MDKHTHTCTHSHTHTYTHLAPHSSVTDDHVDKHSKNFSQVFHNLLMVTNVCMCLCLCVCVCVCVCLSVYVWEGVCVYMYFYKSVFQFTCRSVTVKHHKWFKRNAERWSHLLLSLTHTHTHTHQYTCNILNMQIHSRFTVIKINDHFLMVCTCFLINIQKMCGVLYSVAVMSLQLVLNPYDCTFPRNKL